MKMRKVLSLVLALVMVFSLAAPVMAAEKSAQEIAGDRLLSLGVIDGYADGTLGLDRTITRAEITVILAKIRGMGDAANLLKDTPSKFSDVKVNEWYTGWINLASSQGWVKGDPQGTFRPNDPVSHREIVTMLLKALGYDDNLPGEWPTNYLAKAAALGITKGIVSDSKAPAVRGDVFVMTSRTLDENTVVFDKDYNEFIKGDVLLAEGMDFEKVEGVVTDIPRVTSSLKDNQIKINGKTYKVVGNVDFEIIFGADVDAWLNDDGDVVFIDIDSDEILYDALEDVTDEELTLVTADADYDLAKNVKVFINGESAKASDLAAEYDYAKVVLDEDGDVAFIDAYDWDDFLVVEKVDGYDILGYGDELDAEDFVIVKNGDTITLEDLKEGDILFYNKAAEYAEVFNKSVEGEIERIYVDRIRVNGTDYKYSDADAKFINEDGDITNFTSSNFEDVVEEMKDAGKVAVFVNRAGDMVFLSGDLSNLVTTSKYFFVTEPSTRFQDRNKYYFTLEVLSAEGKEISYDVLEADVKTNGDSILLDANGNEIAWGTNLSDSSTYAIKPYSVIRIAFDKDGDIDEIQLLGTETITDGTKTSSKYINGVKIDSDAVVFLAEDYQNYLTDDVDDIEITTYSKLDFDYIKSNGSNHSKAYVKDDKVVAFVINASDRKEDVDTHLSVVTAAPVKVSGENVHKVGLVIDGEKVSLETKKDASVTGIDKGDFVTVDIDTKTGKIKTITEITDPDRVITEGVVSNIKTSNKSFKIGSTEVKLGANAVLVDATKSTYSIISSLSSLKEGDTVKALRVDSNSVYVDVVVRLTKAGDNNNTPPAPVDDFVISLSDSSVIAGNGINVVLTNNSSDPIIIDNKIIATVGSTTKEVTASTLVAPGDNTIATLTPSDFAALNVAGNKTVKVWIYQDGKVLVSKTDLALTVNPGAPDTVTVTADVTGKIDVSELTEDKVVTPTAVVKDDHGNVISNADGTWSLTATPASAVDGTDYTFDAATGKLTIKKVDPGVAGTYTITFTTTTGSKTGNVDVETE